MVCCTNMREPLLWTYFSSCERHSSCNQNLWLFFRRHMLRKSEYKLMFLNWVWSICKMCLRCRSFGITWSILSWAIVLRLYALKIILCSSVPILLTHLALSTSKFPLLALLELFELVFWPTLVEVPIEKCCVGTEGLLWEYILV